jgi:hypothetical protein
MRVWGSIHSPPAGPLLPIPLLLHSAPGGLGTCSINFEPARTPTPLWSCVVCWWVAVSLSCLFWADSFFSSIPLGPDLELHDTLFSSSFTSPFQRLSPSATHLFARLLHAPSPFSPTTSAAAHHLTPKDTRAPGHLTGQQPWRPASSPRQKKDGEEHRCWDSM